MQRKKALELGRNRTTVYYMFSGQYVHVLSAETGAQCTTFSLGKKGHSVLHVLRAETGAQCTTCSQGRNRGTVYYMLWAETGAQCTTCSLGRNRGTVYYMFSGQKQGHSVLHALWAETGAQCTICSLGRNRGTVYYMLSGQQCSLLTHDTVGPGDRTISTRAVSEQHSSWQHNKHAPNASFTF